MDSGMLLEQDNARPAFEPLSPLLPEELCWIIDRSFACEVSAEHPHPTTPLITGP